MHNDFGNVHKKDNQIKAFNFEKVPQLLCAGSLSMCHLRLTLVKDVITSKTFSLLSDKQTQ